MGLSKVIEKEDSMTAIELVQFAYFKKVEKKKKKRAHDDGENDSDTEDEAEVDEPMEQTTQEQEEEAEAAETVIKPPEAKKARVEKTVVTAKAVNETEFE